MAVSILFWCLRRGKKLTTEQFLKIHKFKKKHFLLFSDSYERSRRAVRGKQLVQTSRVFFLKIQKMQNIAKIVILWPGPMGPGPRAQSGPMAWPMGPAHGSWPKGPMGPGPKWAHFHLLFIILGVYFQVFWPKFKNVPWYPTL